MSICVVGGTGFLGRHLCRSLHLKGIDAFTTSRNPDQAFIQTWAPTIGQAKFNSPQMWQMLARAQSVIYLGSGAKPGSDWRMPSIDIEANVAQLASFSRAVFDINPQIHFVFASSAGTIYGSRCLSPSKETDLAAPESAYALSKHLSEQILEFYSRIDSIDATLLRIANPIGYWQMLGRHGLVSSAMLSAFRSSTLDIFGDGHNVRDYFDADDLADAMIMVAQRPLGGHRVYNVGSGTGLSELDAIRLVEDTLGISVQYEFKPARPFDLRYSVADTGLIREEYGWSSQKDIRTSILKMAAMYKEMIAF